MHSLERIRPAVVVGDGDPRVPHEEPQVGLDYVRSTSLCL
jgi:hypothetical protein